MCRTVRLMLSCVALLTAAGCGDKRAADASPDDRPTLTVLTYNILANPTLEGERFPALLNLIEESDADVIALQEIAPWSLAKLKGEPWVQEKYHAARADGRPWVAGGQFILSKYPIEKAISKRLPGGRRRPILVATIRVKERTLAVGTVHLASPLAAGATRAQQLDAVFPLLEGTDDAILLGDFNFGDGEKPDTQHLDESYEDMWLALRPDDRGYTWNIEKSKMAKNGSFPGEESRRVDRILVRSSAWQSKSIRIIGDDPVVPGERDLFPSDHFGLVGVLAWDPEAAGRAKQEP